ncbi:hypothetical protein C8Q77DRAFT_1275817 [Trametes polyzona]|nr:hypothetical protein C8Q77DRAFT_1275817 [Trametes polyzona]
MHKRTDPGGALLSQRLPLGAARELWTDSIEILDKNQYLLTPIRTRLFPKASPGVLRNLLNTPSLRAFTPDQSVLPEDSSLLGSPLQSSKPFSLPPIDLPGPLTLQDTGNPNSERGQHSAPRSHPPPASLLPSPPPSTELPSLEAFCARTSSSDLSASGGLDYRAATKRPEPSSDSRRSSQGRRSPFPELIPSGLRAAPCSPLLTTRPVVHDSPPPLSSVPAARAANTRTSDLRMHAHRELAFGVVRDFQRVLDELQGLGHGASAGIDHADTDRSLVTDQAPSQSILGARVAEATLASAARRGMQDKRVQDEPEPRPLRTDGQEAPAGRYAADRFPSGGTLLGHMGDNALAHGSLLPASAPSVSFTGLEDEFIELLMSQAAEEEAQAEQLRVVADRLSNIARRKKMLATAIMGREL